MSSSRRFDELLTVAVRAACTAGDYARRHARRRTQTVKRSLHDVKLQLDLECQALAERVVRRFYPDHAFLGEERLAGQEDDKSRMSNSEGLVWIIDPIDGTVNYSHGFPFWCCSVAVGQLGRTLAAAVYAPQMGELYTATCLGPARLNGRRLRVSTTRRLRDALVMTGLDQRSPYSRRPFERFLRIAQQCQRARVVGCAALDLCRVASGEADGYFESGIFVWDVAAAALIVERAGGRTELLASRPDGRLLFLASNKILHSRLRRLILVGRDTTSP